MTNRNLFSLCAITFLAIVLRFYLLGLYPVSLNLDEVAIGYNAYSILETGRDEYGTWFPIAFRSHDDYKAPLYIYLTTIPIALWGLNAVSVRFVSAVFGVVAIVFSYLLARELVKSWSSLKYIPAIVALMLTLSPWHIQYSRAGFEVNVATTFIVIGIWSYLKGLKQPRYWIVSAVSFAASLYTYHSTKLFVPLFGLVLGWHARKLLLKHRTYLILGIVTFLVITIPVIRFSLTPEGQLRFKGTNIFNNPTLVDTNKELKVDQIIQGRVIQAKLFHLDTLAMIQVFLRGYFAHFTYEFLFWGESGPPQNYTPNVGLLYLWELPFIIIGGYLLFKKKNKYRIIVASWLLLAPVASGLTWDYPSATRTVIMLPTWQILAAIGISHVFNTVHPKLKGLYVISIVLIGSYFVGLFLHNYYRIAPKLYASAWQDGYQEAVVYAEHFKSQVDSIVVSNKLKQPQNFFAFYSGYDPEKYIQTDGGTKSGGYEETGNAFGVYKFHPIEWNNTLEPNTMYIDIIDSSNKNIDFFHIITSQDNQTQIGIYLHQTQLIVQ